MKSAHEILVVEDDKVTRTLIAKILEAESYKVSVASNGVEALETIGERMVSCVITDIEMEILNGLEFLKILNKEKNLIPVIVVSKYKNLKNTQTAWKYGAFDFVEKPIEKNIFLEVVKLAITFGKDYLSNRRNFSKNSSKNTPPVDWDAFRNSLGGDLSVQHEIFESFIVQTYELEKLIFDSVRKGDEVALGKLLHKFLSSTQGIQAKELSRTIQSIEAELVRGAEITISDITSLFAQTEALVHYIDKNLSLNSHSIKAL